MGHFWIKFFLGNSQIQLRLEKKVYKLSTNGLYFRGLPGDALQPTKRIRVITLTVSFVETHKDEQGKRLVKAVEPNLKSPN